MRQLKVAMQRAANKYGFHMVRHHGSRWGCENYPEKERSSVPRYVNIGAGAFFHPFWHNLDAPSQFYDPISARTDIVHDLCSDEPLPISSSSIEIFYCSHVIEHLDYITVSRLFGEVMRCLKPGGILRISVPDALFLYSAYMSGDLTVFRSPSPWGSNLVEPELIFAEYIATGHEFSAENIKKLSGDMKMDKFLDALCAAAAEGPENHRNWFDAHKLIDILSSMGFIANESRYLQSRDRRLRDPRLFDNTCPEISLYVEAIKPIS